LRIGLDIDEVVAELHVAWLAAYNAGEGTQHSIDIFDTWHIGEKLGPRVFDYLTASLYDVVQPTPDALSVTARLRSLGHTLFYVSSCGKENEYAPRKLRWLRETGLLLPHEADHRFVPGRDKRFAPVSVLLDDHVPNVATFTREGVLLTRHHNRGIEYSPRIETLADFPRFVQSRSMCRPLCAFCGRPQHAIACI